VKENGRKSREEKGAEIEESLRKVNSPRKVFS